MRTIERCDICDEPTGGAGRLDDSLVCANCNRVICGECQAEFDEVVICKPCTAKAFGVPLDRLEAICNAEREQRCVVLHSRKMPLVWGDEAQNTLLCPECGIDLMGLDYDRTGEDVHQCPDCGQPIDTTKAVTRAEAVAALAGQEEGRG